MPSLVSEDGFTVSDLVRAAADLSLGVKPADFSAQTMATPLFCGRLFIHEVQPGLTVTASDIRYLADQEAAAEVEPSLICGILLAGEDDGMQVGTHGTVANRPGQAVLVGFREKQRCVRAATRAVRSCVAGFVLKSEFFERFAGDVAEDGLAELRDFIAADFRSETLPRSSQLTETASRIMSHPYNGNLARLFIESSAVSMLVAVADLLSQRAVVERQIGRRHYERVMHARDILDSNVASPPTTVELARQVGVSVTTLRVNFKIAFGTTIFNYIRNQRLMIGRVLIIDHGLTIAEAGYRVGFSRPAAFTAAYRRHFGHPPGKEIPGRRA